MMQRTLVMVKPDAVRRKQVGEVIRRFEAAGLTIVAKHTAPMHLLEPVRLVKDEGLLRALRFAWNVLTHAAARRRVLTMRRVFRKYSNHLAAITVVATKPCEDHS